MGTVPGGNGQGSFNATPAMIVGQGWDGSAVYGLVGNSICWGEYDYDFYAPLVAGAGMRALANSGSGLRDFYSLCFPGTYPEKQSSDRRRPVPARMQALRSIGNVPFNQIISEMGQNSPTMNGTSLAAFQTVETQWWSFLKTSFAPANIFQVNFPAHAGSLNNTKWTTLADQTTDYPTGMRWLAGASDRRQFGAAARRQGHRPHDCVHHRLGLRVASRPVADHRLVGDDSHRGQLGQVGRGRRDRRAGRRHGTGDERGNEQRRGAQHHQGHWRGTVDAAARRQHQPFLFRRRARRDSALTAEGTIPYYPLYQAAANALIALKQSGALP